MGSISLRNLGVTATTPLFSDLTLTIADGDRVGLVAGNGNGKTTLLRIIAGHRRAERRRRRPLARPPHRLCRAGRAGVAPRPDAARGDPRRAAARGARDRELARRRRARRVRDAGGDARSAGLEAQRRLAAADADRAHLGDRSPTRCCSTSRPTISTSPSCSSSRPGSTPSRSGIPVVIASHDRDFLDATTNRTLFLRPGTSHYFAVPYSHARAELAKMDEAAEVQLERDLKDAKQLRKQAAKLTNIGINSGSDLLTVKAKQLKERAAKIEEAARPVAQGALGRNPARQQRHARQGADRGREPDGDDAAGRSAVPDREAPHLPGRPHRAARARTGQGSRSS